MYNDHFSCIGVEPANTREHVFKISRAGTGAREPSAAFACTLAALRPSPFRPPLRKSYGLERNSFETEERPGELFGLVEFPRMLIYRIPRFPFRQTQ